MGFLLRFCCLLLIALAGCTPTTPSAPPQAATHAPLSPAKLCVMDVRTEGEWEADHIAGAVHLPLDQLRERIGSVAPDKQTPIGVYCASGGRSSHAAQILQELGYKSVENLGGIDAARQKLNHRQGTP